MRRQAALDRRDSEKQSFHGRFADWNLVGCSWFKSYASVSEEGFLPNVVRP